MADEEANSTSVPALAEERPIGGSDESIDGGGGVAAAVGVASPSPSSSATAEPQATSAVADSATSDARQAEPQRDTQADAAASTAQAEDGAATPAKAVAPEGPLSFKGHMWDRFEFLWRQRVEPSEKLLEQVAGVLRSRAQLERQYAESLGSLPSQVRLDQHNNSVGGAVEAVMVSFRNRGEQSANLADQVDEDIVVTLEQVAAQHKEASKKMLSDMQLLTRYQQEAEKKHQKLAARYGSRCWEAEVAAKELLQGVAMKADERKRLAIRVTTLSVQARVAEQEYYASIEQANRAKAIYDQHLQVVLAALQEMEEKRALCLKDCLRKLAVYEHSWLRNMQYDLQETHKSADSADPADDLQSFLQESWAEHGQQPPSATAPEFAVAPFFQLGKARAPKDTLSRRQQREDEIAITHLIAEFTPLLKSIIAEERSTGADAGGETSATPGGESGAPEGGERPPPVVQLQFGLEDLRRRVALVQVLRSEILSKEPQGTELDNAKPVNVPLLTLEAIAIIFVSALDGCDDQSDAWSGRDLMVLAQLFRSEGEGGKTTSLLSRIYSHRIWSKVTFWEDVLMNGLCEAHAAEVVWRRSLSPGSQFQQPPMTSFLSRFVGHMLAFGIRLDQARSAVGATIRKNAALLGSEAKSYETLLLQAYEVGAMASPAASATAPTPAARTLEASTIGDGDGVSASADAASGPGLQDADAEAEEGDDDFEAVALGLPTAEAAADGGSAQALQGLAVNQRSHSDVFT